MSKRPTFYYNGKPLRAGGCMFYVVKDGKREYLLRNTKWPKPNWSDIGGKTDRVDENILDTIVREVAEETNFQLFGEHDQAAAEAALYEHFDSATMEMYYGEKSKYMLVVCEVSDSVRSLPMGRFGLEEGTDKMAHRYKWTDKINRGKMHPRLRFHPDFREIFKV